MIGMKMKKRKRKGMKRLEVMMNFNKGLNIYE